MLKCIIVDDEQNAVDVMQLLVKQCGLLQLAFSTTKPQEVIDFVKKEAVDIVFLDIDMPGMNGLNLAHALKGKCEVVFITGHSQFVTEAFELEVADYLLKPITLPRFINAVHRVIKRTTGVNYLPESVPTPTMIQESSLEHDYFFVKTEQKGKMLRVNLVDIDYVEGMKNYVAIHHCGQKTLALLGLNEMEERLPARHFVRVQKSFIVAMHKIAMVEGNRVKLKSVPNEIIVGDAYKAQFMEALKDRVM